MTELELKQAKETYKMQLEGQRILLESVANKAVSTFTKQYFSNVSEESIMSITQDEILRKAFLSTFGNTKESSSDLFVYLNDIVRTDANISDGQPELVGIGLNRRRIEDLKNYMLFCNLETNEPLLIWVDDPEYKIVDFYKSNCVMHLPNDIKAETYHYSSTSLEKISKGSATEFFNRLQLYYFKQLLDTSYEDALTRVRRLKVEEIEDICLSK